MGKVLSPTRNKPKLLEQVRISLRRNRYSRKTEEAYTKWIREFIIYNDKKHPSEMDKSNIEKYLTHLAVEKKVSASTQNQALCAIVYLYKHVLEKEFGWLEDVTRATRKPKLPVVFSKNEVKSVITQTRSDINLIVCLLYGSGLRLNEVLSLRVKDVDFELKSLTIRDSKGEKDRTTVLPLSVIPKLKLKLEAIERTHNSDLRKGLGGTILPGALYKKYINAAKEFAWQYVFPANKYIFNEELKIKFRYHLHASSVQKEIKKAIKAAKINKPASSHTFRHLTREINYFRIAA